MAKSEKTLRKAVFCVLTDEDAAHNVMIGFPDAPADFSLLIQDLALGISASDMAATGRVKAIVGPSQIPSAFGGIVKSDLDTVRAALPEADVTTDSRDLVVFVEMDVEYTFVAMSRQAFVARYVERDQFGRFKKHAS